MTEAKSHLIRAGAGKVRVLRLAADGPQCWPIAYLAQIGSGTCQKCGCTDRYGCVDGCAWVTKARDLCSRCYEKELVS